MIVEYLHREGRAMEIVAPGFQGANDGEEFTVIDVVVVFSGGKGLREVGAGVPVAIGVGLEEDSAGCMFRCISGDSERG